MYLKGSSRQVNAHSTCLSATGEYQGLLHLEGVGDERVGVHIQRLNVLSVELVELA